MKNRVVYIDIARALCIIWIVSFWHMNQYLSDDIKFFPTHSYIREIALIFTDGILALFTLISGYFMAKKEISSKQDIVEFYKKRLLRFEVPLFISCACLSTIGRGYLTVYQIFTTCFGVAGILPLPFPKTLWYFSMIILFYLLTPIILMIKKKSMVQTTVICIIIYLLFYIGNKYLWMDVRLSEYWPFYCVPLLYPKNKDLFAIFKSYWHYAITLLLIAIILYLVVNHIAAKSSSDIETICVNIVASYFILSVSKLIEKVKPLSNLFCLISFASMFAYLFHRELYIVSTHLIGEYSYIEAFVLAIILFCSSYGMQYAYNLYSKKIFRQI